MKIQLKLKQPKELLLSFATATFIGVVFLVYVVFIGNARTKAAYYYATAVKNYTIGNVNRSKELFAKSVESFDEPYFRTRFEELVYSAK